MTIGRSDPTANRPDDSDCAREAYAPRADTLTTAMHDDIETWTDLCGPDPTWRRALEPDDD